VIRILDSTRNLRDLASLELDDQQLESVTRMISSRDGLILATGPTGSGKTTTLYAMLQEINNKDIKIITLEDPVENQVDGITQINVHNKSGLTFSRGLRSILRQDPDVVLVGEMRDEETAHIAVQAALTGHTVFSTLHTVGTVETITRLADMGIEPYLLSDTLRGVIAQRLIRRICVSCKQPVEVDPVILERLGMAKKDGPFFEGVGCDACHGTGFSGRMAIYEVLYMTPELCHLVQQGLGSEKLRFKMHQMGIHTLRMDAIRKVKAGVTTISEAMSATTRA
jgi:type II secretory ATPase GspE/PulE/Tfp pilus assembly ATPase PilB-like protein